MNVIDQICETKNCYGCSACQQICPKSAITMKSDDKGFIYPMIDENLCIGCKMCINVCPTNNIKKLKEDVNQQIYFAARHKDSKVLKNSSSGGIFTLLSDYIIKNGGIVYGAIFDDNFNVVHFGAKTFDERNRQCGSKYVQSSITEIYYEIEANIKDNIDVLFVGTPCQVAGIKRYFELKKINTEKLFLVDFICHGASSPLIWSEFVKYIETANNASLTEFKFRCKDFSWEHKKSKIVVDGVDISDNYINKNSYFKMYSSLVLNRESCYECAFTDYERVADITIADFWNIKSVCKEMNDNLGASEVLINTKKGKMLFEHCKSNANVIECTKKDVWQPHLEFSNEKPKSYDIFWNLYKQKGFEYVLNIYGKGTFMEKIKNTITPIAKKIGIYKLLGKLYRLIIIRK